MERDERVVLVGEDVGRPGGPYGVTRGLLDRFGELRVRDTPISEAVLVGLGIGGGAVGLRPIVEIMFFDFAMIAMDQIVNQAAKYRYFSGALDAADDPHDVRRRRARTAPSTRRTSRPGTARSPG